MKRAYAGLLLLGLSILILGGARADQSSRESKNLPGASRLLPKDDEIRGWKRSEKVLQASNAEELYRLINGGAGLYINHGFQSFAGQSYRGPTGLELEVYLFDQGASQEAQDLYEDPFLRPSRSQEITNCGDRARIDEGILFYHGVEFIRKNFFVRVRGLFGIKQRKA